MFWHLYPSSILVDFINLQSSHVNFRLLVLIILMVVFLCLGLVMFLRWGFVIHGCIDVYSRYLTYLDASENNSPSTVLRLFHSGVTELGLPARVRYGFTSLLFQQRHQLYRLTRFTAVVTTVRKTLELHITWQSIVLRLTTELCSNLLEQTADLKECGWKLVAIHLTNFSICSSK